MIDGEETGSAPGSYTVPKTPVSETTHRLGAEIIAKPALVLMPVHGPERFNTVLVLAVDNLSLASGDESLKAPESKSQEVSIFSHNFFSSDSLNKTLLQTASKVASFSTSNIFSCLF